MSNFNIKEDIINEVCEIIAHHHSPGSINTANFKLLYDADWLVNLPEEYDLINNANNLEQTIDKLYLTNVGKRLARKIFIRE